MIVDASALMAILFAEDDAPRFARALVRAEQCRISAVNFVEAAIRADLLGHPAAGDALDTLIEEAGLRIEPVTEAHARLARRAYRAYGKGTGHPAALNFSDCFAYALAKASGEPLLFKGDDFSRTDIPAA